MVEIAVDVAVLDGLADVDEEDLDLGLGPSQSEERLVGPPGQSF